MQFALVAWIRIDRYKKMKKIFSYYSEILPVTAVLLLLLITASCTSSLDEHLLHGTWKAVSMEENGKPATIDLSQTGFTFNAQKGYEYRSNINYKEKGTYFLDGKFLVSHDTLNNGIKKSVWIEFLSADSLLLKMNSSGTAQYLGLKKVR